MYEKSMAITTTTIGDHFTYTLQFYTLHLYTILISISVCALFFAIYLILGKQIASGLYSRMVYAISVISREK